MAVSPPSIGRGRGKLPGMLSKSVRKAVKEMGRVSVPVGMRGMGKHMKSLKKGKKGGK
jgi:hypothetical protein